MDKGKKLQKEVNMGQGKGTKKEANMGQGKGTKKEVNMDRVEKAAGACLKLDKQRCDLLEYCEIVDKAYQELEEGVNLECLEAKQIPEVTDYWESVEYSQEYTFCLRYPVRLVVEIEELFDKYEFADWQSIMFLKRLRKEYGPNGSKVFEEDAA